MNYIRICKGVQDKGRLVPVGTNIYKDIDLNKDYYTSAFLYNEEQYQKFKKDGTVAGISDTVTNKLYWDFDSATDLDQAKKDASVLIERLDKIGVSSDSTALFFSGKKGFQIEIVFNEFFTPNEVKNICLGLGEGLPSLDRQIYNSNRILRLPLSKHQDTGLYKIPLDPTQLADVGIGDIKDAAKENQGIDLTDAYEIVKGNKKITELKTKAPKIEEKKVDSNISFDDIDWTVRPKFLSPEKYLLSLGYFEEGERSHALMILCSTFKSLGFNETQTYHFLKSAAELQADRTGGDKFSKKEIYNNIIAQVFSPTWKGGIYSVANDETLQRLSLSVPKHIKNNENDDVHDIKETHNAFISYAKEIDKNTLKIGIPCLDDNLFIQVGRLYGVIGSPGVGKTSVGITIHNNTSKMGIPSIFFSYDMSKYDVYQKLIQKHTRMTREQLYDIFRKGDTKKQAEISGKVSEQYENVSFVFKTGQSVEEMKNTIIETEKKLSTTFKLVVVDYLELVQSKYSDPTQSSAEVIQGLREIAINMNKAVIVFLQPNKMSSTVSDPILSYNAAKGSSSIAQACTAILTVHRPGYSSRTPETDKFFSIDCVKNRSGKLFSADLFWDGLTGNIRELDEVEEQELKQLRDVKQASNNEDMF